MPAKPEDYEPDGSDETISPYDNCTKDGHGISDKVLAVPLDTSRLMKGARLRAPLSDSRFDKDAYQHLLVDPPRAEALWKARSVTKERYPDSFYWGAFVCQGDPGSLSQPGLRTPM